MAKRGSKTKWMTLWRVVDGDIYKTRAFVEDDSLIFEGYEDERYDWEDDRHVHVDDLTEGNGVFEKEADARKYAIKWMNKKIFEYQLKLARLQGTNKVNG